MRTLEICTGQHLEVALPALFCCRWRCITTFHWRHYSITISQRCSLTHLHFTQASFQVRKRLPFCPGLDIACCLCAGKMGTFTCTQRHGGKRSRSLAPGAATIFKHFHHKKSFFKKSFQKIKNKKSSDFSIDLHSICFLSTTAVSSVHVKQPGQKSPEMSHFFLHNISSTFSLLRYRGIWTLQTSE